MRDQAIRAPERWYDADVRIRLSSIEERSPIGAPRFDVVVQWEYTTVLAGPIKRFAVTSDRDEFHDLVSDIPSTSTWFMTPRPGLDPSSQEAFELLQFSVDGEEQRIRRSSKKSGQTYTVRLDDELVRGGQAVRIRHVYRTVTAKNGHRLYVAIAQPTRGLSLTMDYSDTDIERMTVTELVSSAKQPQVVRWPEEVAKKELSVEVPGWLLPQAEVTFVWTLASEGWQAPPVAGRAGRAA